MGGQCGAAPAFAVLQIVEEQILLFQLKGRSIESGKYS